MMLRRVDWWLVYIVVPRITHRCLTKQLAYKT